ncbi:MAG: hypothetical protein DMF90_15200 [Acidobacteria bacterium]|nr:MAG: hypothetical protein DMF90_15200 [Acidobacteriota bacterium]
MPRPPLKHPEVVLLILVIWAIHVALWFWGNWSEGVWQQAPAIDQAHDLKAAWLFWRALTSADLRALGDAWVHSSPVHTPVVPLASGLLMLGFGPSRLAAEVVLPLATLVWFVATYGMIARLYGRSTALKVTALVGTFPVFLIYSRTYLFELPLAAVFACACWALLASEGFSRAGASMAFGLLAGMTALTRGGAPVFLVGPLLGVLVAYRADEFWPVRLRNAVLAFGIALMIAATWYGPNWPVFSEYLYRATYGEDAVLRTGGSHAFTMANGTYYLKWIIAQGPGVPMAFVASLAWAVAALSPDYRASQTRAVSLALASAFTGDFVLLLAAAQHEGARYFLPLMPVVALAIVRAIEGVPRKWWRYAFTCAIAILALHHVIALSVPLKSREVPFVAGFPLWDHTTYFQALTRFYGLRTPRDDFRIPQVIDALEQMDLSPQAAIGLVQPTHAFFQQNALELEATRRRLKWVFVWSPPLSPEDPAGSAERALPVPPVEVILLRFGGPTRIDLATVVSALPKKFEPAGDFGKVGEPVPLGDGSSVALFRRRTIILPPRPTADDRGAQTCLMMSVAFRALDHGLPNWRSKKSRIGKRLAVPPGRIVGRREARRRTSRPGSTGHREPVADKQDLIDFRRKRRDSVPTCVVVVMHIRNIEELLQFPHDPNEPLRLAHPVHLDRQLIDSRENIVWRPQQRIPLRAFHVHLDDQPLRAVAVPLELVFERVEGPAFDRGCLSADAFLVKDRPT